MLATNLGADNGKAHYIWLKRFSALGNSPFCKIPVGR